SERHRYVGGTTAGTRAAEEVRLCGTAVLPTEIRGPAGTKRFVPDEPRDIRQADSRTPRQRIRIFGKAGQCAHESRGVAARSGTRGSRNVDDTQFAQRGF